MRGSLWASAQAAEECSGGACRRARRPVVGEEVRRSQARVTPGHETVNTAAQPSPDRSRSRPDGTRPTPLPTHRSTKPGPTPSGSAQRWLTPVTRPGARPDDSAASGRSQASRRPSATTSTRPSSRFAAQPSRPSSRARALVHQRKPTPCTRPRTHTVSRASTASEATGRPADWSRERTRTTLGGAPVPARLRVASDREAARRTAAVPLHRLRLGVGTHPALDARPRGRDGLPRGRRRSRPPLTRSPQRVDLEQHAAARSARTACCSRSTQERGATSGRGGDAAGSAGR